MLSWGRYHDDLNTPVEPSIADSIFLLLLIKQKNYQHYLIGKRDQMTKTEQ
jgi:hypothetical protein